MARDLADELLQAQVKARLFGGDHSPRLGRLVILERIGTGAMGAVYAAYDPRLDRRVAVKVLHAKDPDAGAQALREARALGKLAHRNVIAIHDADEDGDTVHIVMELATGTPLRAWIHKERTWRDVLRVMRDAATGLAAAHRAGVVHRDIKPDNIIVGDDATRVVDFGLALTAADDHDTSGTPTYMAPEVLAGAPATPASDQFSFGVTLYEALYGERPHTGASRDELRRAGLLASSARPGRPARTEAANAPDDAARADVARADTARADAARAARDDAAPASTTVATTDADNTAAHAPLRVSATPTGRATQPPGWLHAIVKRTLAADPAKRFASMDDVVAALSRDRRRTRIIVAVAGVALAVGAIGGVVAYRAQRVDPCDGADRVARAWNDDRMHRVRASLGSAAWTATALASLGAIATGWEATYRGVCEATRVRGEQSDRLLELRMRCLDRSLERFDALAGALEGHLDAGPRFEAASAIAQLPRPEACASITDAAELALPTDPARRQRALDAERTLDRAWTDYALGRYREARERVTGLATATADLDAVGLDAELSTLAATIEARIGEPSVARTQLQRALAATAKARAPELEYVVWTRLLRHELFAGTPARVLDWEPFARAAALRAGLDGAARDGIVGEALRDAGELDRARERLTRALDSRDPLRGDQRAILLMNLGSIELAIGQPFLAQTAFEQALELARKQLGDGHASLALYHDKLADADRARGRIASALRHHDASIALRTEAYGATDRSVATARLHRAETLLEAGQLARAADDLDASRAIRAKLLGETSARLGEIDAALGDVALARGKRLDAVALYQRAAALDPRLDLAPRLAAVGAPTFDDAHPVAIQPFTVDRARLLTAWVVSRGPDLGRAPALDMYRAYLAARTDDPTLALATADALAAVGNSLSLTLYRAALGALADEPSRMRLHALRALAAADPDAAQRADALAKQMPELR